MKLAALVIVLLTSGCSWLMVAGPPPQPPLDGPPGVMMATPQRSPVGCTRQKFAPRVDTVFAAFFTAGAALTWPAGIAVLATSGGDSYNQFMGTMLIGASALYALMAWPFWSSARSGYRDVAACRAAYIRAFGTYDMP